MEGFIPHVIGNDEQTAFEYLPAAAATFKVGEALAFNANGQLALAAGSTKPQYFSYKDTTIGTAGELLCVTRVRDDIIYETHNSAAFTSVKIGAKVTIEADSPGRPGGMRVTATTTDGVATVVGFDATAVGSRVRVKFE